MSDHSGFRTYYYSRRAWIFGCMFLMFVANIADAKAKLNCTRSGRSTTCAPQSTLVLSLIAMKTENSRFQAVFAVFATMYEIGYIWKSL